MISDRGLVFLLHVESGQRSTTHSDGGPMTREEGEAILRQPHYRRGGAEWALSPRYTCWVCGGWAVEFAGDNPPPHNLIRCERHADRNPCCIEGCKRSVAAPVRGGVPRLANDQAICGTHWRRYVPPRSLLRRTYNAHFRRGERRGWTHRSVAKFERFWDALVRMARRRSEAGHVDEAAINRLFGWDQDGGC